MMRSIQKIILGLGVCGLVGTVGLADADAHQRRGKRLMKMDTNQDGALTRDELSAGFAAKVTRKLERIDANKDGYIDRDEMTKMRAKFAERRAQRHMNLSPEKQAKRAARFEAKMERRFAKVDTDGDGRLGVAEMHAAANRRVDRMFERLDTNRDGVLVKAELAKARKGERRGKKSDG